MVKLGYKNWCVESLKWRSNGVLHLAWSDSLMKYKCILSAARASFSDVINTNKDNPKFLLTVTNLTCKSSATVSSSFTASEFVNFFSHKLHCITDEISNCLPTLGVVPPLNRIFGALEITPVLSQFEAVSLDTFSWLVLSFKSTTCLSDPLPAKLVKEPHLKKSNLDPDIINNFRPISPSFLKS